MPDESSDLTPEETPDDTDIEAEMLRMMQNELGEEGEEDSTEDAMAAFQEGAALEGMGDEDAAPSGNVDAVLEQEMLRAMQDDSGEGGGGVVPFVSQLPGMPEDAEGIERLSEIEVTVTVEIGGSIFSIKDILEWTRDSVIELDETENEPVNVLVNGKLFARGDVVVVGDTFGIRVTELVDQAEDNTRRFSRF